MKIDPQTIKHAFDILSKQNLKSTTVFMNETDYNELTGKQCDRCQGFYRAELDSHPLDACDIEITRRIMES